MYPKQKRKKKRIHHPEPIIKQQKGICILCALEGDYRQKQTEVHHVLFGAGRRTLSEQNGLVCNLCIEHHRTGPHAVHRDRNTRIFLCELYQRAFEKEHTHEEWMQISGKNYL